jgi:hypothetical protein
METRGLIFIPDISGFTKFINDSEIEHSRLIIQELLEALINANESGLEISEIEGDAILFYKFGEPVELQELYRQVEKMFCSFHHHINAYEHRRLCQCKACISAVDLTLKIITHYGEFTSYNVRNFSKLIGRDIIVAHQLLKNDIEQHEYWLVTKNLSADPTSSVQAQWMQWNESSKQTESGDIAFHYVQLSPLKTQLAAQPFPSLEMNDQVKMVSVSREFPVPVKSLFFTAGHIEFRHLWQEGIRKIEEMDHTLPRVGTRHRHFRNDGEAVVLTSSFLYDPENRISFSERDAQKRSATYYIFEKTGEDRSTLRLEFYLQKNFVGETFFKIAMKRKV